MAQAAVATQPPVDISGNFIGRGKPTDQHHLEESCRFCFDVLMSHFRKAQCPKPMFPDGEFPLFVTWNKYSARHGDTHLRGCIGNLSSITLHEGIQKYAAVSAFEDSRFDPIAEHEVDSLECSVTLLYQYEQANDCYDWTIGKHGMIINFVGERGRNLSATYLPFVCSEQGWSKEECISSLVKKAGHQGKVTSELLGSIRLTRYQGCKATVPFADYVAGRKRQGMWHWG